MRLILKPGPFVDAELRGGGIPLWLLQHHLEIHAQRADGDIWRHSDSNAPLLLSGDGLPASVHIEGTHLTLPYVSEDECGMTDSYPLLPAGPAPDSIRVDLRALLQARAHALRTAVDPLPDAGDDGVQSLAGASRVFVSIADVLEALANQPFPLDDYAVAWRHATTACEPVADALARDFARVRSDRLTGVLDETQYAILESHRHTTLERAARAGLHYERE